MANALEVFFDRWLIGSSDIVEDVASFMGPAALDGDEAINQRQGCLEAFSPIGDDEFQVLPLEPAAIEIVEKAFPVGLFLGRGLVKVDHFLLSVQADAQGD